MPNKPTILTFSLRDALRGDRPIAALSASASCRKRSRRGGTVAINGSRPQGDPSRTTVPASPLHRVVRPYAAESLATARHHSHPNAAKTVTFKIAAHQTVFPRSAAKPCDNANTPAGSRKCENGMPSRGCQLRGGRSKPRAHANSRTSSSCDAMAFALLVMIHGGRTPAISGSRPDANQTD